MWRLPRCGHLACVLLVLTFPNPTVSLLDWIFGGDSNSCPEIASVDNFDLDAYIAKSWYVQRQQVNSYQPADSLFCLVATYSLDGRDQWGQEAITVRNYNNDGGVNQSPTNPDMVLCATQTDRAGQLIVAPCFLPSLLGGKYWVVATDYNNYAIVTGGSLTERGSCDDDDDDDGLCTTRQAASVLDPLSFVIGNNQGLWFLTRSSNPTAALLQQMEEVAAALGICTADMLPVVHAGCSYTGATIK
jgi:lipocalin